MRSSSTPARVGKETMRFVKTPARQEGASAWMQRISRRGSNKQPGGLNPSRGTDVTPAAGPADLQIDLIELAHAGWGDDVAFPAVGEHPAIP